MRHNHEASYTIKTKVGSNTSLFIHRESFHKFGIFRVRKRTISQLIPDTCTALWKSL